ncbi:MAG: dTMP kinase [Deltaproteobacteria bacterium]|jgi:dTMP kinase|nr:dTMP kinase [Deltaproteobacteria bacterium]
MALDSGHSTPPAPPSLPSPPEGWDEAELRNLSGLGTLLRIPVKGFLLALEGLDGSGKSTQARLVAEALQAAGHAVSSFREPAPDGELGRKLKTLMPGSRPEPREELRLFMIDRAYDVNTRILPALAGGGVAVMDRYILSSVSYQGARGILPSDILRQNLAFPWPDLTIVLDIEPEKGLERIREGRGGLTPAFEIAPYLAKVRDILNLASGLPGVEFWDAEAAAEEIAERITARVAAAAGDKAGVA